MNILYQCNDKYAPYCGVSVTSLFINNKDAENITVYILDDGISNENKEKFRMLEEQYGRRIIFIDTTEIVVKLESLGVPKYRGSYTTNFKMFVDDFIPEYVDRLLYIDSDTVVSGSLEELFSFDFNFKPIAMALDSLVGEYKVMVGKNPDSPYYNAGVILFNMEIWRNQKCSERIVEHTKNVRAHYAAPDQDLINLVIGDDIKQISVKYNFEPAYKMFSEKQYYSAFQKNTLCSKAELVDAKNDIRIYHFFRVMGEFPWHKNNNHPFNDVFDEYLSISPWSDYIKQPSGVSVVFKLENFAYKVLPEYIFIRLFKKAHEIFMKKSNNLSLKNENNRLM